MQVLRVALEMLGWIENEQSDQGGCCWELKFGLKVADLGQLPKQISEKFPSKIINFFGSVAELTTKVGITRNIERYTNHPFEEVTHAECLATHTTRTF